MSEHWAYECGGEWHWSPDVPWTRDEAIQAAKAEGMVPLVCRVEHQVWPGDVVPFPFLADSAVEQADEALRDAEGCICPWDAGGAFADVPYRDMQRLQHIFHEAFLKWIKRLDGYRCSRLIGEPELVPDER